MPSTIGKCKFRIKHTVLLEGEIYLRNKHKIAFFFKLKCTFFGRKENTIRVNKMAIKSFSKFWRLKLTLNSRCRHSWIKLRVTLTTYVIQNFITLCSQEPSNYFALCFEL